MQTPDHHVAPVLRHSDRVLRLRHVRMLAGPRHDHVQLVVHLPAPLLRVTLQRFPFRFGVDVVFVRRVLWYFGRLLDGDVEFLVTSYVDVVAVREQSLVKEDCLFL